MMSASEAYFKMPPKRFFVVVIISPVSSFTFPLIFFSNESMDDPSRHTKLMYLWYIGSCILMSSRGSSQK